MPGRLLLHICCAPCLIAPLSHLRQEDEWEITGFWYNPNIHPYTEYLKRLHTLREFSVRESLPIIWKDDYALEEFLRLAAPAPEKRCLHCYRIRLLETARYARDNGFDTLSSTLLYSRYQKHDAIVAIGREVAAEFGISFLDRDFRPYWEEGVRMSKEAGMYRQPYCGCVYSEKDRYYKGPVII